MSPTAPETTEAIHDFSHELLARFRGKIPVIKPQSAMFERLGPQGMMIMADLCQEAIADNMMVIMDAKRGDIGSTSTAYAHAMLAMMLAPSDALTVNPFLGMDTLQPFIDAAEATSSGLFVFGADFKPWIG